MEEVYTLFFRWEVRIRIRISSVEDFFIAILNKERKTPSAPISISWIVHFLAVAIMVFDN